MKKRYGGRLIIMLTTLFVISICIVILLRTITLWKAEKRVRFDYEGNRDAFADIVDDIAVDSSLIEVLLDIEFGENIAVPDGLSSIGIGSIYYDGDTIYFEYRDSIIGITPFGILYTEDVAALDKWYRIEQIDDNWYYYRVPS